MAERLAAIGPPRQRAEAIKRRALEIGVSPAAIYNWLKRGVPGAKDAQQASGRRDEFRRADGQLQQLGADGSWAPYVPFRELRATLARSAPGLNEAAFLADFEQLWDGAGG